MRFLFQSLSDDISASRSPSKGFKKKKAFSSEFDAGDDGTIKNGGPKFLSGSKWPKFVIKIKKKLSV